MSTSRKLRAKLAKHRRSARKATSTETARKEPEPEPTESSTTETQASTKRGTVTACSELTGTQFVCLCHWLSGQKLLLAHFSADASDKLTSSESGESEPEEARPRISAWAGQNESPGSTQSSMETMLAPKISQTTSTTRALHFPSSSCSLTLISGGSCSAKQTCKLSRSSSPASYYAKNFKPVAVPELRAFLGLRLQMEKCVIKPRYKSYWQGGWPQVHHAHPRFQSHRTRPLHHPLGFLHLVDQTDQAVDKSDMIYRMLPLFRCNYSPRQQLSLDKGIIPTKKHLAIKQYIRNTLVRWGIKSFLLCKAMMSCILIAEIYTGRVKDRHWPLLGSAGSTVRHLVENSQVTNKNHMLFMDRFYNSVALFHLLKNELGVLAAGTVMPSRKHYPKELSRRLTERGRYEFWCRGALCSIAWKDCKPIHFLSNYHNPRRASTVNRCVGDRLEQFTVPQLVVDYTR